MKKLLLPGLLFLSLTATTALQAAQLRVTGVVTNKATAHPVEKAEVRIYKDGVKQRTILTGANGRYEALLDNNAHYVIRFVLPGHVTKCYTISTFGPQWEEDRSVKEVFIEMTMFERMAGVDLSFFDLPMGIGKFDPLSGRLAWDAEYDARIRPEVDALMTAYERILLDRRTLASR